MKKLLTVMLVGSAFALSAVAHANEEAPAKDAKAAKKDKKAKKEEAPAGEKKEGEAK